MGKPMTNSNVSQRGQRSERLWLPSFLLLAQFLSITPVLLIVFADEQQKRASDAYVTLLDGLDRLSFAIAELENIPRPAWRQQYSDYRGELEHVLSDSAPAPQVRETLARVDSLVKRMDTRMEKTESDLVGLNKRPEHPEPLAAEFRNDGRTARSELMNAQRLVRSQLSTTGNSITQKTTYLKALVAGVCLLGFGVVFVVRRFRVDAAIQRKLQQELRTINDEVIAALAAARAESEAKNQLLAHLGHLMRNQSAEFLNNLAGQVIDYSRMESGRFELELSEFKPARIVLDVVQRFSPAAQRKGLRLKSDIGKGLPGVVKGDPERLRQVLIAFTSNAVRFTQQGEILLRVEEAPGAEGRPSLRFEVRDTGIGITEQVRNRMFQPFSTVQPINPASGPITDGHQETGLGLAISKKLVELMGGKIDVDSEPGRGSIFSFTAVFEAVRASTEPQSEFSKAASPANGAIATAEVGPSLTISQNPQAGRKQGRERRTESRYVISYPTLLRSEDAGIAVIRVLDVSKSGVRVAVPFRLNRRAEVEIRIEGASVIGIVRNCTCIGANEFHVGIQIPPMASRDIECLNHLELLLERVPGRS
jgi:signal transduction histidine kinase